MPMYEFKCSECGYIEEHRMSYAESTIDRVECFNCGADSPKQISRTSFSLTGGGWYASGYTKSS
jgi:putative FmdB family regulatory protein